MSAQGAEGGGEGWSWRADFSCKQHPSQPGEERRWLSLCWLEIHFRLWDILSIVHHNPYIPHLHLFTSNRDIHPYPFFHTFWFEWGNLLQRGSRPLPHFQTWQRPRTGGGQGQNNASPARNPPPPHLSSSSPHTAEKCKQQPPSASPPPKKKSGDCLDCLLLGLPRAPTRRRWLRPNCKDPLLSSCCSAPHLLTQTTAESIGN